MSNKWLICSVHYAKSNWNSLLLKFFRPFIESNSGCIDNYYIFFSENRGDNVILCLKFFDEVNYNKHIFFIELDKYLKNHPSEIVPKIVQDSFPFADHQNNTYLIHSGVFVSPLNSMEVLNDKIRNLISFAILSEFSNIEVDVEGTYTMYIYFQMILFKSKFNDGHSALNYLKNIQKDYENKNIQYNDNRHHIFVNSQEHFRIMYFRNRKTFVDIYSDIWDTSPPIYTTKWMSAWSNFCMKSLGKQNFGEILTTVSCLLAEHLGYREDERLLEHSLSILCKTLEDNS